MRAVVVSLFVVVVTACTKQEEPQTSPMAAPPATVAPPASVAAENGAAPDHADHGDDDHGHPEADDGKDHRALYVDRVAIEFRNFVVDTAGALDDGRGAAFDNTQKKLPATTTYTSLPVEGGGLLVGGKDGSLWYSPKADGAFVVVRDPRE